MGTRIHPQPGEPFCPNCHMSEGDGCNLAHQQYFKDLDAEVEAQEMSRQTRIDRALSILPPDLMVVNNAPDWEEAARFLFQLITEARKILSGEDD